MMKTPLTFDEAWNQAEDELTDPEVKLATRAISARMLELEKEHVQLQQRAAKLDDKTPTPSAIHARAQELVAQAEADEEERQAKIEAYDIVGEVYDIVDLPLAVMPVGQE